MAGIATRVPKRRSQTSPQRHTSVFAGIALFVAVAVSLPILLVVVSSRPDLYAAKPKPLRPGIAVVDWQTLGNLLAGPVNPVSARPSWFGPEVEMVGYMLPAQPADSPENASRFLLVPDAGDWLNPPHLHPGEAIDVRLKDGETTRLVERTPVTVFGRLSVGSMNTNSRAVLFMAGATCVRD